MQNTSNAFKRAVLTVTLLAFIGLVSGCNTAHGVGKDIERTGEKIQEKTE